MLIARARLAAAVGVRVFFLFASVFFPSFSRSLQRACMRAGRCIRSLRNRFRLSRLFCETEVYCIVDERYLRQR